MSETRFLSPEEYFDVLLNELPVEQRNLYTSMRHVRTEPGFRERKFIAYEVVNREPQKIGTFNILDFMCDDEDGSSIQVEWMEQPGKILTVGYDPVQVFDLPVFIHLPLYNKVRWSVRDDGTDNPSLSFLLVVRTQSRKHLRERDVTYFETSVSYQKEFFADSPA